MLNFQPQEINMFMLKESDYFKLHVSVPLDSADKVREALGKAGAGVQGNYEFCSGSVRQTGRFCPVAGASPAIGEVGKLEEVKEELIMVICHRDKIEEVVRAVKDAHPYEEPAIDVFSRLEIM